MPDGTFPKSFGLIQHLHLVKSPQKEFGKGRQTLKGVLTNNLSLTSKQTNQMCYCTFSAVHHIIMAGCCAPCYLELLPTTQRNAKQSLCSSLVMKTPPIYNKTATIAAFTLTSSAIVYDVRWLLLPGLLGLFRGAWSSRLTPIVLLVSLSINKADWLWKPPKFKNCPLEVGRMDDLDFWDEIWSIHSTGKVNSFFYFFTHHSLHTLICSSVFSYTDTKPAFSIQFSSSLPTLTPVLIVNIVRL